METISDIEYKRIMKMCQPHFDNIQLIVESSGILPGNNSLYKKGTFDLDPDLIPSQKNLITMAQKSINIIETGFGMGHSALLMLVANPKCKVTSLDTCEKKYTNYCYTYLHSQFPDRLVLMEGKTLTNINKYFKENIAELFVMDGSTDYVTANLDFFVCKKFLPDRSAIIFNNAYVPAIKTLYTGYCQHKDLIPLKLEHTNYQTIGVVMKSKLKIAVCSLAIGKEYRKIVKYGIKGKKEYCKKHGYSYYEDETLDIEDRPLAWAKVQLILRYLYSNYEYVVWLDADTHIMRPEKKLEDFIFNQSRGKDLMIAHDFSMLNSGVMFIKNTPWSKKFFKTLWNQTDFINHDNWEQGAIIHMYENNILDSKAHFRVVENCKIFNSYYCFYTDGDFLIHLAGCWREKNKGLDQMMDQTCPIMMEKDSKEGFEWRQNFMKKLNQ